MDFVSSQVTWVLIVVPLLGLALTVLVLQVFCRSEDTQPVTASAAVRAQSTRSAPLENLSRGTVQADITGDVVATAGEEERFPWRLAPIRIVAIFATVGLGQAMGTEAPAAYLGVAAGACLGDRGRWWRRLLRPAALAGGAAGVAALMGIPLVGTGYMLELGRRHNAPLSARTRDRGADRWIRRLGDQRRLPSRPDPSGRAQGAAGQPPASRDHGAVHRRDLRSDHLARRMGDLSRQEVAGRRPGVRLALGGLAAGSHGGGPRDHRRPVRRRRSGRRSHPVGREHQRRCR